MAWREHAASLLSLVSHHGVSAVKVSSLKQAKDILLSVEPIYAAELFPYLVELQHSPEPLVRRIILDTIEEIGWKSMEHLPILIPVVVAYLRDGDHRIVRQSIVIGTHLYKNVLAEMSIQLQRRGKVDWWAEELWKWLRRFRDTVLELALQSGVTGIKILSLKFLELNVLLFTAEPNEMSKVSMEGKRQLFNISWLPHSHPTLNPLMLKSDSVKFLGILLNFLQPPNMFPGPITIQVVNSLTAIARKRPGHYGIILSALIDFMSSSDKTKRWHASSVQYSLRTAFLGFLRSTCPDILETREKLHRALRMLNAGEAADQVIRQVDKMIKINERASRDRIVKDELVPGQDQFRKRYASINEELDNSQEISAKRARFLPNKTVKANGSEKEMPSLNGPSLSVPVLDSDLTPAEKMIAMIGALLAEGERGAESLELLVSTFHPDLLADIVIVNMNHFPKVLPPAATHDNDSTPNHSSFVQSTPAHTKSQLTSPIDKGSSIVPSSDTSFNSNLSAETKRDPRRDPRRLDPRRMHSTTATPTEPLVDDVASPSAPKSNSESNKTNSNANKFEDSSRNGMLTSTTALTVFEDVAINRGDNKYSASNLDGGSRIEIDGIVKVPDTETVPDASVNVDCDELSLSPSSSYSSAMEDAGQGFPEFPQFVEMSEKLQKSVAKLAIERMIDSYIFLEGNSCNRIRLTLLSRFIALNNAEDEIVKILQNRIAIDRGLKKGHDLVLHVLYQLYSLIVQESVEVSDAAGAYEKILLAVAKSLLEILPPSDKSFNRLLSEVPFFPESIFTLLDSLCCSDVVEKAQGKETRDSERVTQGLGAVWGLIVGRPNIRKTCLNIALKCASHAQDDIRAKAIRLVANKLYQLDYVTDSIEEFATSLLLKVVHQNSSDAEFQQDQTLGEDYSQSEARSETHSVTCVSLSEAQRHMSLYFALCMKKPLLLRQIFHVYGCSPKTVKQVIHRHVPIVVRSLGSTSAELLHIIADPPDRCDNLLMLVLQVLTEDASPSKDLIETVKLWFKTKVKDVMILIPILSFLPKDEVLPVFPRLVNLETEKFQMALAHILQGSANTGPALTPSEVLVAIHAINPERDGLPLKKITDACTTCFEQRTVFTQHVLEKSLNQMVEQSPLPLLFMRTVIQAIDAFPSLVDFVMEILSKLVARQIWKMPKLWVGFLKCVYQTQPHSFPVLLQLPPQQLETALNKHASLKPPLASYAALQPSLPRGVSVVLGLANDSSSAANQS